MRDFEDIAAEKHPGMKGKIREKAAKNLFEPLLPQGFNIGINGKIIDHYDNNSKEIDLIIFNRSILPAIMYYDEYTYYPAEICFFAIEIKSNLTATEIKDAIDKAKYLKKKIKYVAGLYEKSGKPIEHSVLPIVPVLFAFKSDFKEDGKSEIERYLEYDKNFVDPYLRGICVVGSGCWLFKKLEEKWDYRAASPDYGEVIQFLSIIINSLYESLEQRGHPRLGLYLMKKRKQ